MSATAPAPTDEKAPITAETNGTGPLPAPDTAPQKEIKTAETGEQHKAEATAQKAETGKQDTEETRESVNRMNRPETS